MDIQEPLAIFSEWLNEELQKSDVRVPTAVCLSTLGIDGFPNARFVSVKELKNDSFIITGPLNSRKGVEISKNNKVALTFWWTETERQVRIQGLADLISEEQADTYFEARNRTSQAISVVSEQGQTMKNPSGVEAQIQDLLAKNKVIVRPESWGGYAIKPLRMEFLEFKETRFHERKLYENKNGQWHLTKLQP